MALHTSYHSFLLFCAILSPNTHPQLRFFSSPSICLVWLGFFFFSLKEINTEQLQNRQRAREKDYLYYMKNVSAVRMFSDLRLNGKQTGACVWKGNRTWAGSLALKSHVKYSKQTDFRIFLASRHFSHMEPGMKVKTQESKQSNPIPFGRLCGSRAGAHSVVHLQTQSLNHEGCD